MKTVVTSHIGDRNEKGQRAFELKAASILSKANLVGNFSAENAYMTRGNGRGSYNRCLDIIWTDNNTCYTISIRTTDSQMWDNWNNPTSKNKRDMFLAVLEDGIEDLVHDIQYDLVEY